MNCYYCANRNKSTCERCIGWNCYVDVRDASYTPPALNIERGMELLNLLPQRLEVSTKVIGTLVNFGIKKVIFNYPATVVLWEDGTKTIVKCGDYDVFDPEKGLAMAIAKKALGNQGNYFEVFKQWIPEAELRKGIFTTGVIEDTKGADPVSTEETVSCSVYSIKDYCAKYGCSKYKVYRMIQSGALKAKKDEHGRWLIFDKKGGTCDEENSNAI